VVDGRGRNGPREDGDGGHVLKARAGVAFLPGGPSRVCLGSKRSGTWGAPCNLVLRPWAENGARCAAAYQQDRDRAEWIGGGELSGRARRCLTGMRVSPGRDGSGVGATGEP